MDLLLLIFQLMYRVAKVDLNIQLKTDNLIKKQEPFFELKSKDIDLIISKINKSNKPVLWLGNGLRGMNSEELRNIILKLKYPLSDILDS